MQGDKKMVGALDYLFDISKKQGSKKAQKPWIVRTDVEDIVNDQAHDKVMCESSAPVLFLYFDASSGFSGAVICADMHKIEIESSSCVSNAVLAYVALFHVCQVGYNDNWHNFLASLEHLLLRVPFQASSKYVPIKLQTFLDNFALDIKE